MKKLIYTWKDFDTDTKRLVKTLDFQPRTIISLARGGLTLGVRLSSILNTDFCVLGIRSYKSHQRGRIQVYQKIPSVLKLPILIVDDISDSGETFKYVLSKVLNYDELYLTKTLSLFIRETTKFIPDYYLHKVKKEWIVFPWEK